MSRLHSALSKILLEDPASVEGLPRNEGTRLGELLESSRLEPILYKRLKDGQAEERLSPERLAAWKMAYVLSVGRSLAFGEALEEIIQIAARIGTPVRLLRGTHLAFFVYPSPELRPLGDLDIQTPHEFAVELQYALRRRRFLEIEDLDPARVHCLPRLAREGVTVRIHKRSTPDPMPWDAFSESARHLSRPRLLRPEPLLVHLAQDASARSFCHSLLSLHDMHVVVEKLKPDWERVFAVAREANLSMETHLAIGLVEDLLGPCVPQEFARDFEELGSWATSRRDLLRKLSRTAVVQYPASWRLSTFIGRVLKEARACSGAVWSL